MKHRIILTIAALALCLGLCPLAAFAAEGAGNVARVELDGGPTTYCASIDDAWAAAQGHTATITLLADAETQNSNYCLADVESNTHITFDGGEYTLTGIIYVNQGGTLDIIGGTFDYAVAATGGTLNIADGTFNNRVRIESGTLTISGGTVYGNLRIDGGTAKITGGRFTNCDIDASFTISGGLFTDQWVLRRGMVTLTGGMFNFSNLREFLTTYTVRLAEGYVYRDGNYDIVNIKDVPETIQGPVRVEPCPHRWDDTGLCTICGITAEARITIDSETTYCVKLADVARVEGLEGKTATITLLKDVANPNSQPQEDEDWKLLLESFPRDSHITMDGNGKTISGYAVYLGNGSAWGEAPPTGTVELKNCTIRMTESISLPALAIAGNIHVTDCTVTNEYASAVSLQGGTFQLTGCTLEIERAADTVRVEWGTAYISDCTVKGSEGGNGLFIYQGSAKITSGSFTGMHSIAIYGDKELTLADLLADGCCYYDSDGNPVKEGLEGKLLPPDEGSEGVTYTYTVRPCTHTAYNPEEGTTCPDCGLPIVAQVEASSGSAYYADLPQAWAAAKSAQTATLHLMGDAEISEALTVGSGEKITLTSGKNSDGEDFAIRRTAGSTSGDLPRTITVDGGTLRVESGKIEMTGTGSGNCFALYIASGTAEVAGGTITATGDNSAGLSGGSADSVKLTGGTFQGASQAVRFGQGSVSSCLAHTGTDHYAYYLSGSAAPMKDNEINVPALSGKVEVKQCSGEYAYTHIENTQTHKKTCNACGYTPAAENCVYNQEVTSQPYKKSDATCTEPAIYYMSCLCGAGSVDGDIFSDGQPLGHRWTDATCTAPKTCSVCSAVEGKALGHDWATAWSSDETNHWHVCGRCSEKNDSAAHTPGDWIIDQPATTTAEGSKHKECGVCGRVLETEAIPQLPPDHRHSYGEAWKSDTAEHWKECECGEKAELSAHTPGGWIIDQPATTTAEGSKHKECGVCGRVLETEAIPQLPPDHQHSYGEAWKSDTAEHWKECECGEKAELGAHTPGGWIIDQPATSKAPGSKHKECSVCGYTTATGSIPATGGGSGGWVVPSGPSGSGTSKPPVTTVGPDGKATTTTAPTATTQGGTASATVDTAAGQEIVKQAVANQSENVVVAPKVTGSVTKAEVSLPAATVGQIGSQTRASLTVSTPVASVTIPNGGLGSLSSAGGTVTVAAEKVGSRVEFSVTAGGKTVESIPGGVTLTVPAADAVPGTVAVLLHPDGTREVVRKSVAADGSVTIPLKGSAKLEIVDNSKAFGDVPATSWEADAVSFASSHELFHGTAPGQFSPDVPMSRGMLAVVLHNMESNPEQALTGVFADVDNGKWYAEGVAWAAEMGIISGYGSSMFGPDDDITREQLAVMLWRYAGSPAASNKELPFADAGKASDWAEEALRWATENGIIHGKDGGVLDPAGKATRAETAQMLMNFLVGK